MEDSTGKMSGGEDKEDGNSLPGFRFHPTDEELLGFYLRRKVENKPFSVELIKQIDIYKYDPWDLPRVSNVGEKEWYFFCMRGRKYRNSIRPNRVTGSGFWKATGIDKPIYSDRASAAGDCIGLKKSLVYYIGAAGKGTKTDWMMHEFRLPPTGKTGSANAPQQAEVWTLCRIFKRVTPYKQPTIVPTRKLVSLTDSCSKTSSLDSDHTSYRHRNDHHDDVAVGFGDSFSHKKRETLNPNWNHHHLGLINATVPIITSPSSCNNDFPSFWNINGGDFVGDGGSCWDELRSVVQGYSEH